MGEKTEIAWCDSTFNPWVGCTKVGPGCDHCYAAQSTPARVLRARGFETWGPDGTRRRSYTWGDPPRWNKRHAAFSAQHGRRQRVFCASLADVFDNEVPAGWRVDLFRLIAATPNLAWLLLTKRVGNVIPMLRDMGGAGLPANVWLGATVVNQAEADRDIPKLLQVPARVRFLSIEPMLGPVDVRWAFSDSRVIRCPRCMFATNDLQHGPCPNDGATLRSDPGVDWVICGGESGPGARPSNVGWFRSLAQQCKAAGVAFHMKQLGAQPRGWCAAQVHADPSDRVDSACDFYEAHECREPCPGRCAAMVDKKGGDMAEWPEDLRVREFPR